MNMKSLLLSFASALIAMQSMALTKNFSLAYRDDPSTTIVIGWTGDAGTVYYGTTDFGTTYTSYPSTATVARTVTWKGQDRKFVRLTGLTPNTVYYFVVHDAAGQTSQRFKFQTLSDDPNQAYSFISGGDSRQAVTVSGIPVENCPTDCRTMRQRGFQLVAKFRPDFIAFNGDFVRNTLGIGVNQEWEEWFADLSLSRSVDGKMYPLVLTTGNHEDAADMYNMFDIPQEEYYALNIHGGLTRFYVLNSELNACSNAAQLNWITNDLNAHTGTASEPFWKIVQYHIPTFAMGNGYGLVQDQMNCWIPLLENAGVKVVMESHTHITKWTWPSVKNSGGTDFLRDDVNGIVYIGEGQWGAPHRSLDFTGANQKPYVRAQGVFDSFFWLRVSKDTIEIRNIQFQNVAAVGLLVDDELGSFPPSNVTYWNPTGGSTIYIVRPGSSDVADIKKENRYKVYPVPSNNFVTVDLNTPTNATIEVYNSLGKLCEVHNSNGLNKVNIDLLELCNGVNYLYIKTADGHVEHHKLLKVD
jgi:acid phosphatase type 7